MSKSPDEPAAAVPVEEEPSLVENFAFVMNIRQLQNSRSFVLAEGHQLRRANHQQIEIIKEETEKFNLGFSSSPNLWEASRHDDQPVGGSPERKFVPLPNDEWRYFVVMFSGLNSTLNELKIAFDLSPVELEVAFTVMQDAICEERMPSVGWNGDRLFHFLREAQWTDELFVDVSANDVLEINKVHDLLRSYDHTLFGLKDFFLQMSQLKGLPYSSPLRFLGYFGILESLLTHLPNPKDPYDSITRQVKKKLALLDHRWKPGIDYSNFGNANSDTVWTRMYQYRSVIAHGGTADFSSGELQVLKNSKNALRLLKETTKALIRQTLVEPQLIVDLKEC